MITLFFWSRFIFQKAQLCQEREEDVVTRAEAQCLQAVREERRDAALAEVKQDFQFSGTEEDLFPARKRGTTDGIYSICSASSCIFRIFRTMWMPAVLLMLIFLEVNRRGKLEIQSSFKKYQCGSK